MCTSYHVKKWKHIHLKYWSSGEIALPTACRARPFEQRAVEENLLVNQPEQAVGFLTEVMLSHRIVVLGSDPHYV